MERKNKPKQEPPVQKDSQSSESSEESLKVVPEDESKALSEAIEVLSELPEEQKDKLNRGMMLILQQSYRGPIPPAKEMKGYLESLPSAPDRILTMAEKEQTSRIEQTKYGMKLTFSLRLIGQLCALIISLTFAGGAIILGLKDHDGLAGTMVGFTLISIVSVFVIGRLPYFNSSHDDDKI